MTAYEIIDLVVKFGIFALFTCVAYLCYEACKEPIMSDDDFIEELDDIMAHVNSGEYESALYSINCIGDEKLSKDPTIDQNRKLLLAMLDKHISAMMNYYDSQDEDIVI